MAFQSTAPPQHTKPPATSDRSAAKVTTKPIAADSGSKGEEQQKLSGSQDQVSKGDSTKVQPVEKWPGWPGDNVFRLVVPVTKVGSIIGRKGELIRKICDETRGRVRILEPPIGTSDRIVLVSGQEELDAEMSPAMEAAVRVFKRVTASSGKSEDSNSGLETAFCSIRLLVASSQASNLIGKQGSVIKSIQETSGATMRILSEGEMPTYATADEKVVELHGETFKVEKAFEIVLGHLRKFLVDRTVIPVFEKAYNAQPSQSTLSSANALTHQTPIGSSYPLSLRRDPSYHPEMLLDVRQRPQSGLPQSGLPQSGLPLYGEDRAFGGPRSTGLARPIVTQMTQTLQVPLMYAKEIIGMGGSRVAYIRVTSGADLTIKESLVPDEITIEIKGTTSQVQTAQLLIEEITNKHKEAATSVYGNIGNFEGGGLSATYGNIDSRGGLGAVFGNIESRGLSVAYGNVESRGGRSAAYGSVESRSGLGAAYGNIESRGGLGAAYGNVESRGGLSAAYSNVESRGGLSGAYGNVESRGGISAAYGNIESRGGLSGAYGNVENRGGLSGAYGNVENRGGLSAAYGNVENRGGLSAAYANVESRIASGAYGNVESRGVSAAHGNVESRGYPDLPENAYPSSYTGGGEHPSSSVVGYEPSNMGGGYNGHMY